MAGLRPDVGRCPSCGSYVARPAGAFAGAASVQPCPNCSHPVVIVPPRDPPPLYTWEVYPNLYPSAPMPKGNPYRWPPGILALLACAAVLLLGASATLGIVSGATAEAGPSGIAGTVREVEPSGIAAPALAGAEVRLTADAGAVSLAVTNLSGAFSFAGVPMGGLTLNATYPGFRAAFVYLFDSPFYASPDLDHLVVLLSPALNVSAPATSTVETLFPNMESFITSVGSSSVLLAIGGIVAVAGTRAIRSGRVGPAATAAAAGAAVAPASLYLLGVTGPFPILLLPAITASVFGALAATLAATMRYLVGPFEGDGPELGPD